jgi:hypothetical protein
MKFIARQAALTAIFVAALYGMLLAITFIVQPDPPRDGRIDLWTAGRTIYLTLPKYAFLGRDALDVPEPKILLLGASNTGVGFRQTQLQALVPCAKVSNLAIGSANITELRQMIDLVHDVQSDAARRSDTFVFGLWFGMFVDTALRWPDPDRQLGDTDLDIERYRYGFYRRGKDGPVAVLPPSWLRVGVMLIRPYLLFEKVTRDVTEGLRRALYTHTPERTDAQREAHVETAAEKADALQYWRRSMGNAKTISADQVALLRDMIGGLLQSGNKVVLVDLPIPKWLGDASQYQPGYVAAMQGLVDHFAGRPGFADLTMPDLTASEDFSDEVHPKPHVARVWVARLAETLNSALCPAQPPHGAAGTGRNADRFRQSIPMNKEFHDG